MRAEDLYDWLKRRPFQPFRIRLSNGEAYEVGHPELMMVGRSSVLIGTAAADASPPVFDELAMVALMHVAEIEPIAPSSTPSEA